MNEQSANIKPMRIKCAAIRYDGNVYEGRNHSEIGLRMIREGICSAPYPYGDHHQGFVTECGRYVRRSTALAIAIKAGQVVPGKTIHSHKLFSEDLPPSRVL